MKSSANADTATALPQEMIMMDENPNEEIVCSTLSMRDQRSLVFHLLYAMDAFDYTVSLESIADNYGKGFNCVITPQDKVFQDTASVIAERDAIDEDIRPLLDNWRFERLGVATRLILRYAVWELRSAMTDSLVVINEAIELAKAFAEDDAYKFINGILDQWVKKYRPLPA
jgi:transcription antitermination factor NusB